MLSGLKNKAAAAASDAQKLATSSPADIKERASSMAAAATDKAKENAEKYKTQVKEKASEAVDKAKDGAKEFANRIGVFSCVNRALRLFYCLESGLLGLALKPFRHLADQRL